MSDVDRCSCGRRETHAADRCLDPSRVAAAAADLLAGYSLRCANCGITVNNERADSGCPECGPARAAIAKARGGK